MPELNGNAEIKRTDVYGGSVSGKTLSGVIKSRSAGGVSDPVVVRGTGTDSAVVVNTANPNVASGEAAFATGRNAVASGRFAFAGGANSDGSGNSPTASGIANFAYGVGAIASGTGCSVAFGQNTEASGNFSFAAGAETDASGNGSVAFGQYSAAQGTASFAAGNDATATATGSAAIGQRVIASGRAAMAIGQYNIEDTSEIDTSHGNGARKYLFTIGNGTADNARSNAMTVDWDGNLEIAGDIQTGNGSIADAYAVKSKNGSVVSFNDGADSVSVKDLTVAIEPVQSGSGDPSPENVRPITGWTGANVYKVGKNLLKYPYVGASGTYAEVPVTVNSDGTLTYNGTANATSWYAFFGANTTTVSNLVPLSQLGLEAGDQITISTNAVGGRFAIQFNKADGALTSPGLIYVDGAGSTTGTIPSNAVYVYIGFRFTSGTAYSGTNVKFQIEKGSSASDWEPYSGTTYSISFGTDAGTVYGGTLDVTTGLLTVDRVGVDMGTLTWNVYSASYPGFYCIVQNMPSSVDAGSKTIMCSRYGEIGAMGIGTYFGSDHDKTICRRNNSNNIMVQDAEYETAQAFTTAMSGVQLVYELATPVTYQLTPTEVKTLLEDNNIWADTGDSTVKYRADPSSGVVVVRGTGRDSVLVVNGTDPNTASGNVSFAAGSGTEASGYVSTAIGAFSIASGIGSFAGGRKASSIEYPTTASGEDSFAFGLSAKATGNKSVAFGQVTNALANMAFAAGNQTTASGNAAFAMGYKSIASGASSVAIGTQNTASEECAVALGYGNTASEGCAVALGADNTASGVDSFAAGGLNVASGEAATALGLRTIASGKGSLAVGSKLTSSDETTASGLGSVAIGLSTLASGGGSVAMGQKTVANATCSAAIGNNVKATGRAAMAIGQFNVEDTNAEDISHGGGARKYLFIIGNGTADDARSNAMTVDWDGNGIFAGKLTVGAAPTADMDVATKKYVDDHSGGGGEVTVATAGAVSQALDAGTMYHFTGALTSLTITLAAPQSGEKSHYHFDFVSGATAATLTMPNTVIMPDGFSVQANKRYEVDVLNGYGMVTSWTIST